jgi:hypothetical protein
MTDDKLAPATKQDLQDLEARMAGHFDGKITEAINASEDRIKRHFDVAVEAIRHDLLGANADKIALIDDRVDRIEVRLGLSAA